MPTAICRCAAGCGGLSRRAPTGISTRSPRNTSARTNTRSASPVKCASCTRSSRAPRTRWGRPEAEGARHGFRHRHRHCERFVEAGAARRGAGLHPRLVLRHPDDHRRLLCRDGGGGDENLAHSPRHRGPGAVEPDRRGYRERLCHAQRPGAGADRFRGRHRFLGAPGDGARGDEARRYGGVYPGRLRAVGRRNGRDRDRGQAPQDPVSQPGDWTLQHRRPDPAPHLGLWPEISGADRPAQCKVGMLYPGCRRRAWRHRGHEGGLGCGGTPRRRSLCTAWVCGCVLGPGEPADSKRAIAQAGPRAATLLHRAADVEQQGWQNTMNVPEEGIAEEIAGYVEMARQFEPPDARYLQNHRGHFVFVKPEERPFVTAELIRRATFTATEQELTQRVEALHAAGWNQLVIPMTPGEERAIDDWARIKDAFA